VIWITARRWSYCWNNQQASFGDCHYFVCVAYALERFLSFLAYVLERFLPFLAYVLEILRKFAPKYYQVE